MSYIQGESREQVFLLPEAINDYVGPENPVRFLDIFVEKLDLVTADPGRSQCGAPPPPASGRIDLS